MKQIDVTLPLGRLVAVTGVSGSGKSSLIFDILDRAARKRYNGSTEIPGAHEGIDGWEHIDNVVTVDQAPIGRIPRSNAATYTDTFTPIREVFAATREAKQRTLGPGSFSFNIPGGRCERCEGAGVLNVNMHFLPDVQVRCPACHGRRFKKEVLAVHYRGTDIAQVLDMTIEEALTLFQDVPAVASRLRLMVEVGLGYLQLGQPATTLSGGEAQRIKLAKDLARGRAGHTLYLLDEPTTGLHLADVKRLLVLLQRLVDAGNSVVVVEHHLELVQAADWLIDLGPEGGDAGGRLLASGTTRAGGPDRNFVHRALPARVVRKLPPIPPAPLPRRRVLGDCQWPHPPYPPFPSGEGGKEDSEGVCAAIRRANPFRILLPSPLLGRGRGWGGNPTTLSSWGRGK